eukprot:SAG31_NODE_778_length_12161_cov_101.601807_11_plen_61_part_00
MVPTANKHPRGHKQWRKFVRYQKRGMSHTLLADGARTKLQARHTKALLHLAARCRPFHLQ